MARHGKSRTRVDWKNYKPVGVPVVDMCAATIFAHRLKRLPIKAIHLQPKQYERFKMWLEEKANRELQVGELIQFDEVNIEKGDVNQSSQLLVEMYA